MEASSLPLLPALGREGASAGLPSCTSHIAGAWAARVLDRTRDFPGWGSGQVGVWRWNLRWGRHPLAPLEFGGSCPTWPPGPLEPTCSAWAPPLRGVSKCTVGNADLQMGRVAVITLAWQVPWAQPWQGARLVFARCPWRGAGWRWARGSDLQPLVLPPPLRGLGHRGQQGGEEEAPGRD